MKLLSFPDLFQQYKHGSVTSTQFFPPVVWDYPLKMSEATWEIYHNIKGSFRKTA